MSVLYVHYSWNSQWEKWEKQENWANWAPYLPIATHHHLLAPEHHVRCPLEAEEKGKKPTINAQNESPAPRAAPRMDPQPDPASLSTHRNSRGRENPRSS